MVLVPKSSEFVMGTPTQEPGREPNETLHRKRIDRTVALAAASVTVKQYRKFNPDLGIPDVFDRIEGLPIAGTSWYQAAAYCNWLSQQEGIEPDQWCYIIDGEATTMQANYLSLSGYRLPTEAELEYATRAGSTTSRYYGHSDELLRHYAWYVQNSQHRTQPVGTLKPNDFGLFDMHGNVFCWAQDDYNPYPKNDALTDDVENSLTVDGTATRALRGGSYNDPAEILRSGGRFNYVPSLSIYSLGFRVARTVTE